MIEPNSEDEKTLNEERFAKCQNEISLAHFEGELRDKRSPLRPADAYCHVCFQKSPRRSGLIYFRAVLLDVRAFEQPDKLYAVQATDI